MPTGTDTQARDVLLFSFDGPSSVPSAFSASAPAPAPLSCLLVGLGDGVLLLYTLDMRSSEGLPTVSARRRVVVGAQPIRLSCFVNGTQPCVFASGDRPTAIYSSGGKLVFSVVNVGELTGMVRACCRPAYHT